MLWRSATATTIYVYQSSLEHFLCNRRESLWRLVIATHHVWQTSVRVNADGALGYVSESLEPRQQLLSTKTAVESYRQEVRMA